MSIEYQSLNEYCRKRFGHKLYKLSLQSGCTCPNRDGTLDTRGCIFCSAGGSGDFAASAVLPVAEQLKQAKHLIAGKLPKGEVGYIAYFQSYTNTYGPLDKLQAQWREAIADPTVEVLSVATRPDCLGDEVLAVLAELNQVKPVWVELGLQTVHETTAKYIRRGYPLSVYNDAVRRLHQNDITVITHVILGLPGESTQDMLDTVQHVVELAEGRPDGIKLQLLHVLKGTDLAHDYAAGKVETMEPDAYFALLVQCLQRIPQTMVVHRLTGDGPKKLLIVPQWTANKRWVMNTLQKVLRKQ